MYVQCVYVQCTVYITAKRMFFGEDCVLLHVNNSQDKYQKLIKITQQVKIFLATLNNFEGTNTHIVFLSSHCRIDFCAYVQYKHHQPAKLFISSLPHSYSLHPDLLLFLTSSILHTPFFLSLLLCLLCTFSCSFFILLQLVINPSVCLSVWPSVWEERVFWCGEIAAVCTAHDWSVSLLSRTTRSPRAPSPRLIHCTPQRCGETKWWPHRYPLAPSWPLALSAPGLYAAGYLAWREKADSETKANVP